MTNFWKIDHYDLPGDTRLCEIAMLGSHDAGTYAYVRDNTGVSLGTLLPFAFVTQNLTLREQAQAGCNYFDIRVAQNKDGSFSFFHGPSVANGDAARDVKELLEYASEDRRNFYVLKIAFKSDKSKDGAAPSDKFLEDLLASHADRIIYPAHVPSLGSATVSMLWQGKNIGVMVHHASGAYKHWVYKEQVHTKWANMASVSQTARFLLDFHSRPAPENKLHIIQTNVPFASPKTMNINRGVASQVRKHGHRLADAVKKIPYAGIISTDYVGTGTTLQFKEAINARNWALIDGHVMV
jgi:insecticidal toxin complex protein TccC